MDVGFTEKSPLVLCSNGPDEGVVMTENPDAFAEQAKVASDQAQEIDPDAVSAKEPATKWIEDQQQEILGQE